MCLILNAFFSLSFLQVFPLVISLRRRAICLFGGRGLLRMVTLNLSLKHKLNQPLNLKRPLNFFLSVLILSPSDQFNCCWCYIEKLLL